ncbi:MAG: hypothetical protein PWQ42_451 [Sulfurospirillum sp.]|jgi:hypothetical protein|nr:hypothetical protein [Sulfurospirillum sp.]DAB32753.1 MAG TPA: hypothetical protein CFH79_02135 [Sulfurospirillum sp. UBA11407]DAB33926.1 MAG TPA: hypothetical protein CFH82_07955 [Sulfurospirillum sp. UBA12182]
MKKFILGFIFLGGVAFATDYTTLSTEELVALRGTVPTEERDAFKSEMQSRASALSYDERVALGITQQKSTTASGYGQKLRDGSGAGSMSRGANAGGKGKR